MLNWKIDTLDARGGLGFASWRAGDLSKRSNIRLDTPCLFFGAPHFQPEPVANRAIALSASRGAFQTGLFVGTEEIGFASPAAVAEFIRRAYLRSGGGDGADGGTGDGPPPMPPEVPDLPSPPDTFEEGEVAFSGPSLRPLIVEAVGAARTLATTLKVGESRSFKAWPTAFDEAGRGTGAGRGGDGPEMLARAAVTLIFEMIRRFPTSADPFAFVRWQRDARKLASLLARMDLWPILLNGPYLSALEMLVERLLVAHRHRLRGLQVIFSNLPSRIRGGLLIYWILADGSTLDSEEEAMYWLNYGYGWREAVATGFCGSSTGDPLSDLWSVPIPQSLAKCVGSDVPNAASVYHALIAFTGAPTAINQLDERAAGGMIDIVLFGSACIVASPSAVPLASHWNRAYLWEGRGGVAPAQRATVQVLADEAWAWLRGHLPTMMFAEPLEEAIEAAAGLRYQKRLQPRR